MAWFASPPHLWRIKMQKRVCSWKNCKAPLRYFRFFFSLFYIKLRVWTQLPAAEACGLFYELAYFHNFPRFCSTAFVRAF